VTSSIGLGQASGCSRTAGAAFYYFTTLPQRSDRMALGLYVIFSDTHVSTIELVTPLYLLLTH
jgi:hypothetical protein